ncbi:MAG: biopolymer transporter ExbD [Nitrospinae bacterium]|nr:biopolymer transporter ExbD [Nitrospinota bacterium]
MVKITKGNKKPFKPDLAPLIDVVFLLLIFYMLTFAISGQGLNVKLPPESATESQGEEALFIRVLGVDSIRVNNETTSLKGLESVLKKEISNRKNKSVTIQTDDKTKYDIFVRVFDLARQAGAEGFSLVM